MNALWFIEEKNGDEWDFIEIHNADKFFYTKKECMEHIKIIRELNKNLPKYIRGVLRATKYVSK